MSDSPVALETVCDFVGRATVPLNPDAVFHYANISSIDADLKSITGPREVTAGELQRPAGRIEPPAMRPAHTGDVLVSLVRPQRNAVALVPPEFDSLQVATDVAVLRPHRSRLDASYLFYFVMSPYFVTYLTARTVGTTIPRVRESDVRQALIPLPHLQEQRRVVKWLDRARAVQRLHGDAADLWRRLVPAVLIEEIDRAHEHHDGQGQESAVPLRELVTTDEGVKLAKASSGRGELPLIRPSDLRSPLIIHGRESVERTAGANDRLTVVPAQTIVIAHRAADLAQRVPLALTTREAVLGPGIAALVPTGDPALALYLYAWLLETPRALSACVETTSRGDSLNIERLLDEAGVPLPPPDVMPRWAALSARLSALAQPLASRESVLAALMTSLLERTFPSETYVGPRGHNQ